jgi:hypothetical protein
LGLRRTNASFAAPTRRNSSNARLAQPVHGPPGVEGPAQRPAHAGDRQRCALLRKVAAKSFETFERGRIGPADRARVDDDPSDGGRRVPDERAHAAVEIVDFEEQELRLEPDDEKAGLEHLEHRAEKEDERRADQRRQDLLLIDGLLDIQKEIVKQLRLRTLYHNQKVTVAAMQMAEKKV